jgi:hypothetical protein
MSQPPFDDGLVQLTVIDWLVELTLSGYGAYEGGKHANKLYPCVWIPSPLKLTATTMNK